MMQGELMAKTGKQKHVALRGPASALVIALAFVSSALAQSPSPSAESAPSPTPACTAPEFRQFDFWIGKWNVTNPKNGKQVGTSDITRVSEGCAIQEQWTAGNGTTGMSINYFDSADQEWHQDWVGGDGAILHLHGKFAGDAMILSGEVKTAKGKAVLNRVTWSKLEGGKVKQEWATSPDDGQTWQTSFVGIYQKQS